MKRFARLLGVTLGLAALGFVVSLAPQKTASGIVATNVNVVNTPAAPVFNRDVDNPADQPFVGSICGGATCSGVASSFHVPTTFGPATVRRYVIEYYSTICTNVTDSSPSALLGMSSGGQEAFFRIGPLLPAFGALYSNQQTRIYADPGSSVEIFFANIGGSPACSVTVSGYLVLR